MRVIFFVEGRFRLTNQMLSDLRAAGHYEGEAALMRRQGKWRGRKKPGYDLFSQETQAIRLAVKASARSCPPLPVDVTVLVVGHRKHDPDAWYLLAKAVVDGLVDVGLIGSDRFGIGYVSGRVMRTEQEEEDCFALADSMMGSRAPHSACAGAFVILETSAGMGDWYYQGKPEGGHA
jgi:hypothetical protein